MVDLARSLQPLWSNNLKTARRSRIHNTTCGCVDVYLLAWWSMAWRSSKHPSQWYCWGVALCLSHAGVGMSLQRRLMWRQLLQLYCCRSCYCWWTCGFGWRNLDFSILITLDSGFSRNIMLYSYHGVTYPFHISSAAACKNNYFPDRLKMLIFLITYSKLSLIKWSWALMRKSNIPKYHFQIPLIPYHFRLIKINQNTSIIPVK